MADLPVVYLDLRNDQGALKATWDDEGNVYPAYAIDLKRLERCADKVRKALSPLVAAARTGQLAACAPVLKNTAAAGHELYQALFYDAEGSGRDAAWIQEELASKTWPYRVTVRVGPRIHIPWGLVHDAPPERLGEGAGYDDYAGFWCIKHLLGTVHQRAMRRPEVRSRDAFRLFSVINEASYRAALDAVESEESSALEKLFDGGGRRVRSCAEIWSLWEREEDSVGVLYFYCHADGSRLALGPNDMLDIDSISRFRGKVDQRPRRLVFLNGCSTAVGSAGGGFLEATSDRALCGFIGTEVKVPDVFALRFGATFLHTMVNSGKPVYEVMAELRRQQWPLGLLYSLCAHPDFRVAVPQADLAPPAPIRGNFSLGHVGSQDLEGTGP